MRRLWPQPLAAAVFLLAWVQSSTLSPKQESGTFSIDPPTPYTHYLSQGATHGRILVIHGLDANRELMGLISAAFADGGFDVYTIDLPGHGDSRAAFGTDLAEKAVQNTMALLGENTAVLGHSLGAGILLDLSASRHFSTMVLLAPPPLPIDQIRADRVLIATGAIDLPRIRSFVPVAADIGGTHVDAWILPWAAHTTPIFNPVYIRRIVEWAGGDGAKARTGARLAWLIVMFAAALVFGVGLATDFTDCADLNPLNPRNPRLILVHYIAACGAAMVVLKFVNPIGWIRLFGTDYLVGFVFISGSLLAVGAVRDHPFRFNRNALLKAFAAAAYVIAVLGFVTGSRVIHMSLSDGRWWRFPVIFAAGLPLFTFDELIIRRIQPRWKSHAAALITRVLLMAFLVTGVLILNRESAFLVLIAPLTTIFWVALWFAAAVVHQAADDPLATAVFCALVQAWAFAAWFVTI